MSEYIPRESRREEKITVEEEVIKHSLRLESGSVYNLVVRSYTDLIHGKSNFK